MKRISVSLALILIALLVLGAEGASAFQQNPRPPQQEKQEKRREARGEKIDTYTSESDAATRSVSPGDFGDSNLGDAALGI